MAVICVIKFDNSPHGIYYAGQIVKGNVTLQIDEVKKVNAVVVKVLGYAATRWSENSSSGNSSTMYFGHEDYLKSVTYVMGSKEGPTFQLEPGTYNFNYECQIPMACPSSFEGNTGHIRYQVIVALARNWKFDDTFSRCFTVAKVVDLNYDEPLLYEPATIESSKTFGIGLWKTDPLKMHLSIPKTGYIPGQIIPIDIVLNNESDVLVKELKVSLIMDIIHHSQSPTTKTKLERISVIKLKGEGVLCLCKKQFKYELLIPATPPTCFNLCSIIKITYKLEVEAKVKGLHTNHVQSLPITIGNVPPPLTVPMPHQQSSIANSQSCNSAYVVNESIEQKLQAEEAIQKVISEKTEQDLHGCASAPPPSFDEAVEHKSATLVAESADSKSSMSGKNDESVCGAEHAPPPTFEEAAHQNVLFYSAEPGNLHDIQAMPIDKCETVEENHDYTRIPPPIFEEATHLVRANRMKNAFSPKYPNYRYRCNIEIPFAGNDMQQQQLDDNKKDEEKEK